MVYTCNLCNFFSISNDDFKNHILRKHRNDPHFKITCDACGATYHNYFSYRSHFKRHHAHREEVDHEPDDIDLPEPQNLQIGLNDDPRPDLGLVEHDIQQNQNELNVAAVDQLKMSAGQFILKMRAGHKISARATCEMLETVSQFTEIVSECTRDNILRLVPGLNEEQKNLITHYFAEKQDVFAGLQSTYMQNKFFRDNFSLVEPVEIVLGHYFKKVKVKGNKVFLIASSLKMLKDKATKWLSSSEDDPPSVYTSDGTEIFDEEVFEVISQTDTTLLILKSGETLINYDVHKSTLQPDLSSSTDTDISSERSDFIDSEESASIELPKLSADVVDKLSASASAAAAVWDECVTQMAYGLLKRPEGISTSRQYTEACQELIKRYPNLARISAGKVTKPWVAFKKSLSMKVRHIRHYRKKRDNTSASSSYRKAVKVSACRGLSRESPSSPVGGLDEDRSSFTAVKASGRCGLSRESPSPVGFLNEDWSSCKAVKASGRCGLSRESPSPIVFLNEDWSSCEALKSSGRCGMSRESPSPVGFLNEGWSSCEAVKASACRGLSQKSPSPVGFLNEDWSSCEAVKASDESLLVCGALSQESPSPVGVLAEDLSPSEVSKSDQADLAMLGEKRLLDRPKIFKLMKATLAQRRQEIRNSGDILFFMQKYKFFQHLDYIFEEFHLMGYARDFLHNFSQRYESMLEKLATLAMMNGDISEDQHQIALIEFVHKETSYNYSRCIISVVDEVDFGKTSNSENSAFPSIVVVGDGVSYAQYFLSIGTVLIDCTTYKDLSGIKGYVRDFLSDFSQRYESMIEKLATLAWMSGDIII
ncbi:uncharacterized protein LOC141913286 isoform X3 [Tubulanus polymorphus]|uniref:uncharacterized protein LOC141913286 isoform X3 n=1 Tax=Tubulanus polymorphus TaxID=672921 RepID=UPI003DA54ED9